MILTVGLTAEEIRILQEFRRLGATAMGVDQIRAIKHPVGGGEAPARKLVTKGYLAESTEDGQFTLTAKANEFLSYNPVPESSSSAGAPAATAPPEAE